MENMISVKCLLVPKEPESTKHNEKGEKDCIAFNIKTTMLTDILHEE